MKVRVTSDYLIPRSQVVEIEQGKIEAHSAYSLVKNAAKLRLQKSFLRITPSGSVPGEKTIRLSRASVASGTETLNQINYLGILSPG